MGSHGLAELTPLTPIEQKQLDYLQTLGDGPLSGLTPAEKEEKRLEYQHALRKDFIDSVSQGPVGRFQAVKVDSGVVFILDTKKGYLWMWGAVMVGGKPSITISYQGRVVPGINIGDTVDKFRIRKK